MKKTFVFKESKVAGRVLSLLFVVFFMVVLGSCASMTKSQILTTEDALIEGSGYVYGSFVLIPPATRGWEKYIPTMGIIIQNLDTSEKYSFVLKFKFNEQFQITAVPPGNYRIVLVEYLQAKDVLDTDDFDIVGYQRNFVVEPNTAIYIGDFTGESNFSMDEYGTTRSWSLEIPTNNYDETTVALQEKYPFFTEPPITFVSNMKGPQVSDTEEPSVSEN